MTRKHWGGQIHIFIASAVFFAVLTLVYQIAAKHNQRLDLTRDKIHSIAQETIEILKQMDRNDILIRAFFAEEDPASRHLKMLLKDIETHHPHFYFEFHDPDRSPSEARKYRIDAYQTTIVEFQNRTERLHEFTEEALANALIRLAHPEVQTLCFATGHGEVSLTDTDRSGLTEWKQVLEDHQYEVKEIQIMAEGIPSDCKAVIMAGPHYEILPKELDLLQKFPGQGRGFLLLIDPMDPGEGRSFAQLLKPFGLKIGEDVVVDKVSQIFGGDYLTPLITQYADHPVTRRFRVATFLPIARTVAKLSEPPQGVQVTELAFSTTGSWAETNLKKLEHGEATFTSEEDIPGPVSLAAAVEIGEIEKGARMIVVGDSDFLTNAHLRLSGNKDFALNLLQWLVRDDRWISIRAKTSQFEPLFLKVPQSVGVALFTIGGVPLTALVLGSTGLWIRRKKSQ